MRSACAGTVVMAFAFFDGVFLGAPIALLAGAFRVVPVYCGAVLAVVLTVIACCGWLDRRWDEWFTSNGGRMEARLESCARAGSCGIPSPGSSEALTAG